MDQEEKEINNGVIEAIRSGKAKMRPKWHFVLQASLVATVGLLVFFVAVYMASFAVFELDETGLWFVPAFGAAGWTEFFGSLPWVMIFLCAVAILLVIIIMRRYSFGYHWPILYSLLAVIIIASGGSALVTRTPLYDALFHLRKDGSRIPVLGNWYGAFAVPEIDRVYRGEVLTVATSGFILKDFRGHTSSIVVATDTSLPNGAYFAPGDTVVILGDRIATDTIRSEGVVRLVAAEPAAPEAPPASSASSAPAVFPASSGQ